MKYKVIKEIPKTNTTAYGTNYKFRHGKLKKGTMLSERTTKNGDVMVVTPLLKRFVCRVNSALYQENIEKYRNILRRSKILGSN